MKKNLISQPISMPTLIHNFLLKQNFKPISFGQFYVFILLFFVYTSLKAQQHTFTTAGNSIEVPAGVTQVDVKAWGAGGAGGGASNAPILDGRAGAGGGGGAYARSLVTVVPGTTLNVVVGLATTGTTASGTAGGNSTITGYETSILAQGGKGGEANSTGIVPLGGAGGSLSSSVGNLEKTAGGSGGNGTSGLLSALISTGAGGAGGGPGGGAGGASVSSVALANLPGNAGASLGGGGSGGINSSIAIFTGPAQVGGNGAHGQVTIDYTCPIYSLTATTATVACLPSGNTNITLTSSAVGLPVGNYTVTYSRGATTGLTALMTVTTAGTGTFSLSGLTPAGTITITITGLKSGICISPITANNSVNVTVAPVTVGGTVSGGGTTICGGSTSGPLSLTGQVGSILRWESLTSPSVTWVPISNTAGLTNYTSAALAATTQFRAVIQSGTCTIVNSVATTVTVNTQPSITLGTVPPVCISAGAQSPVLTYSNAVASPTLYNITWATSPTNNFVAVPDTALPSQITIAIPAGTAAGTYIGTLRVKNATGCSSSPVNFNVIVNPLPSITLGSIASVCTSATAQTTQLNYTAATNSPTTYSIIWNASPANSFAAVTNAGLSASPITINVPAGTAAGTYTGALTVRNANGCISSSTNFNVVVNPLPSITLGSIAAVCASANAQTTQLNYTAATNSPTTYSIVWNASPANSFATVTNAGLSASPITINVPAGTTAGTYTGALTVSNANGCISSSTNFNVVVNPLPSITLGSIASVCTSSNTQTTQLNYTAATNSPTTYSIVWNASPANSFAAVTNAGLSASPITINVPAGTAAGTYTGALTVSNANGCVSSSTNFNVIVNPLPSITLGSIASVCTSANAQTAQLNYTAPTNSPTTYSVVWNASPANSFAAITNAGLSASPITINVPAGTASGTYTGALTVRNANGCVSSSTNFNVIVTPLPSITLGSIAAVCASANAQTTQLNYSAATNSPTTYSIVWNPSPANSFVSVTNAGLSASPISINVPAGTAAGTYTGALTVSNANGCISSSTNFNVIVNPLPSITLGSIASVCTSANAQTAQLNYTAPTNSPTTYSVVWNASPANSFVAVTNAGLSASPITINVPAGTAAGTYTGTLTVSNANGCTSSSTNFNVIVNPLPSITLGSIASVCTSTNAQTTQLNYTAPTNSPTTYSIVWNASPANSFVTVTNAGLSASPITINIPAGTAAGTYTGALTVSNANGCISSSSNFNVIVNSLPSITLGSVAAVCTSANAQTTQLNYTAATNSPTTYSIVWNASPANSFAPVTNAVLSSSPITIDVPAGTLAGTYTGALTVSNANGCISSSTNFNVIVNPLPSITLGSVAAVCASANAQTTQLNYSAATNSPTTYSIVWNASPANSFAPVTNEVLSSSPITINIPAGTAEGTYTGTLTISNANGCVSSSTNFDVIINPLPSITLGVIPSVCKSANAQTTQLNYTDQTASPTSYSIVWNASPANSFASVTNAGFPSSPITINIPAGTAEGTYTGTLTLNNVNGCISSPINFDVVVNPLPSITLGSAAVACASANAQTTQLNYTATTASPTNYNIVWNASPANNFVPVTNAVLSSSSITIDVPAGTAVGTYSGTLTVSNAEGCLSSSTNFNVVVNSLPPTPISGTTTQTNCVSATGSVMLSGLIPSITWTITQSGTFPNTYTGTGTSYLVQNLAAGTYTFTVRDGANCPSLPTSNVAINNPSTNTWNGSTWSTGSPPTNTEAIVFAGNYTTTGNLGGCSCVVNSGVTVTVNPNHTLTIINSVDNNGGTLIFENDASLVQLSNAVNSGNILYKRTTPAVRRYDLTYWSSPVTRNPIFKLRDLSPGTLGDKYYKYDPIAGFIIIYNGSEEMVKGYGYNIRAPQTYDINVPQPFYGLFIGVPNNGPVSIPLGGLDKWALLGNPYPSAIFANQFIVDNQANLYGTLYFWTHNSMPSTSYPGDYQYNYNAAEDYAIYNLTGTIALTGLVGTGATSPGNQSPPLGYIAAGQAFFVKSKTNQNAVFTNSMRVSGSNSQFYKNAAADKTDTEKHRIWINFTNTQGAFKQLLVGYVTGATNSWDDNYDGETLNGNKYVDFYSINNETKLAIQGRATPFDDSDIVPLGYRAAMAGEFTIAIDHAEGDLSKRAIYLEDKNTGTVQDLQAGNFKFTTAIGTFDNRFVLRYGKTLGTDDFENNQNDILISVKNKVIKLATNSNTENLSEVTIFDVSGKMVYNKKKIGTNKLEITDLKADNQVIIAKVVLENGKTVHKKIILF